MDTAEKISFGMFLADSDRLSPLVAIIGSGVARPLTMRLLENLEAASLNSSSPLEGRS